MTIVILIFISVIIVVLLQAKKEYKNADKNINSLILEAANATSAGDYNRAIQLLTSALNQNSMYHNVWNSRGENYMKLKMYDQALADFNKSISINPDRVTNHMAYLKKNKIYKIMTFDKFLLSPLPKSITKVVDKLTLSDIDLGKKHVYNISNISPGIHDGESSQTSMLYEPQFIILNLKEKTISIKSQKLKSFCLGDKFEIENISHFENNKSFDTVVYIGRNVSPEEDIDELRISGQFCMGNKNIAFINHFMKGMVFHYNSNWIIEKS